MQVSRRRFLSGSFWGIAGGASLGASGLVLAGCGGGGNGTASLSNTPTAATRAHIQTLHGQVSRQLTSSGSSSTALVFTRNRFAAGAAFPTAAPVSGAAGTSGWTAADAQAVVFENVPNLGGFLKNVAGAVHQSARHAKSRQADDTTNDAPDAPDDTPVLFDTPPVLTDDPNFYYDFYLELWTSVTTTPDTITYALFSDEAKTQSAGNIITRLPTDYNGFPQVYASSYTFTAGYLSGAHGNAQNITNGNGSFSSDYTNVYADGTSDTGKSNGDASGNFSWQSRTDGPGTAFTQGAGTFRADGSGGSRFSTSENYAANYVYNADGSGRGQITGGDPGMPVIITWDTFGNTTVRYADGTSEQYAGYGYTDDGIVGGGGSGGSGGSDGTESGGGAVVTPPASGTPIGL